MEMQSEGLNIFDTIFSEHLNLQEVLKIFSSLFFTTPSI